MQMSGIQKLTPLVVTETKIDDPKTIERVYILILDLERVEIIETHQLDLCAAELEHAVSVQFNQSSPHE